MLKKRLTFHGRSTETWITTQDCWTMDVCHLFRKPGNSTQGRIQVEAFVPVECFWKKVRPSRVITFVLLLLFSLFNHQFVPNLYQCYEKPAMPMIGRFHIIREPLTYSSNLLYGSPNIPEHINLWAFLGGVFCMRRSLFEAG